MVTGDQYLRLWNKELSQYVASNDDYSGSASQITYHLDPTDKPKDVRFEIHEGCFSSGSCSGKVSYAITNGAPLGPTGNWPTGAPTVYVSKLLCQPYNTGGTNSAQAPSSSSAYKECQFQLCPGQNATVGSCGDGGYCSGDQYLRLNSASGAEINRNDDKCYGCSQIEYSLPSSSSGCSCYTIIQGCYSMDQCSGVVSVVIEGTPPASSRWNNFFPSSYERQLLPKGDGKASVEEVGQNEKAQESESELKVQSQIKAGKFVVIDELKIDLSTLTKRLFPEYGFQKISERLNKAVHRRQAPPKGVKRVFLHNRGTEDITSQARKGASVSSEQAIAETPVGIPVPRELATVTPAPSSPKFDASKISVPTKNDDAVCLVRLGNTFALPVTTHYGNNKKRGSNFSFSMESRMPTDIGASPYLVLIFNLSSSF